MASIPSTIVEFDIENRSFNKLSMDEFEISENTNKIYWVHWNTNERIFLNKAIQKLHLPDTIVELCLEEESISKLIDSDDALTLQIQSLLSTDINRDENPEIEFGNLVIYLAPRFCFTATSHALPALMEFIENYPKAVRYAKTPCFILFLLLDNVVNDYGKILFALEMIADQLDLSLLAEDKNIYNEVMDVKRQLIKVKRYSIAIREFLMRISSRNISVVSEQCRLSLYNLSSHSHTIVHEVETIRDLLNGLLDQIDNNLMQRMNETMRVLTAFASIFLPLTLITGIYGMNFRWIPELNWEYGYFGALALIFLCGFGLWLFFKKKKWF